MVVISIAREKEHTCGRFIGGAARYLVSIFMKTAGKGFPWGTLVVNLVG